MINEILQDRENRYHETLELIDRYQLPVICGKINYPGNNKNTTEAKKAFDILQELLTLRFADINVYIKRISGADGNGILIVVMGEALEVKKIAVEIEQTHPLGRIFDIDVYENKGKPLGREALGLESRRCLLCNDDARVCSRTKKHPLHKVIECVNIIVNTF